MTPINKSRRYSTLALLCGAALLISLAAYVVTRRLFLRRGWAVPLAASIILALLFGGLFYWQHYTRRFFPIIRKRWLIPLVPFVFALAAVLAYYLPVEGGDVTKDLTFIFGAVSVVSLAFSLAVLVTLRETFHGELQQMDAAIDLIQSTKAKLVFIALTPNLGYARAVYRQKWDLCNEFTRVLDSKLRELLAKPTKDDVEIRIGLLGAPDRDYFYEMKRATLSGRPARDQNQDAADEYQHFTGLLDKTMVEVETAIAQINQPSRFLYVNWKMNCVAPDDSGRTVADFPPLGILIADNHTAIIHFNSHLLRSGPVDLRGRILRSPEEIEAFALLVDSYLGQYKR